MKKVALKRLSLITVVLFALVAGSLSQRAKAAPRAMSMDGHCGEPFTAQLYCEMEVDERSELKRIAWCICYNFVTGEVYVD